MYDLVPTPGEGKEKVMKVTNRKRTVIVILIMAMLITLPTANVSAESNAYMTEDPNAEFYPYPIDMSVLSNYLIRL